MYICQHPENTRVGANFNSPLRHTQTPSYHARDVFLCIYMIYMYICQRSDNTRVGANCNSPIHMGEFEMWTKYNVGELGCGRISIRPYDTRKLPHTMPMTSFFVYLHDLYVYLPTFG